MPAFKYPRTSQPQEAVNVSRLHAAYGAGSAWPSTFAGSTLTSATGSPSVGAQGKAIQTPFGVLKLDGNLGSNFTIVFVGQGGAATNQILANDDSAAALRYYQLFLNSSGAGFLRFNTVNANVTATATGLDISKPYVIVASSNGSAISIHAKNFGGPVNSGTATLSGTPKPVLDILYVGDRGPNYNRYTGKLYGFHVLKGGLSAAETLDVCSNPWRLFTPQSRALWILDGTGAGVSSVYSDIATAFNVRGPAQTDLAPSFNLRGAASQDINPAFNVRGVVPIDLSPAFNVRGPAQTDLAPSFNLRGAASQDINPAFNVRGVVPIDLAPAFNVRGLIQIDESASYVIRGAVSADITPDYSIMTAGVVASDLTPSYQVRGIAQGDMAATYNLRGSAQGDLANSYAIRGAVSADMSPSYAVAGSVAPVQSDLTVNYSVFGVAAACPTAADIAAAVRFDLTAELARIDAAISSRSTVAAIMGYDE